MLSPALRAIVAVMFFFGVCITHAQETVLFGFDGTDGSQPEARMVFDAHGNLYGTTFGGGATDVGTVFELTPDGAGGWSEHVLHEFNRTNGALPTAGVILDAEGDLYGTTSGGGAHGRGTLFELMPNGDGTWTEKVLYSFGALNSTDGQVPYSDLVFDANGSLYGTTNQGGADVAFPGGTVFEVSPNPDGSWTEQVLHSFTFASRFTDGFGSSLAGCLPHAGVIFDAEGNLYGTLTEGGANLLGAVFELSPSGGGNWTETVLHSFDGVDGDIPHSGLIFDATGDLYGATTNGGVIGAGTVYELSAGSEGSWTEKVLYSFGGAGAISPSGIYPRATLALDGSGNLYGTAQQGGVNQYGTVFELSPDGNGAWTQTILSSFASNGTGGISPYGGLVLDAENNIYGTTNASAGHGGDGGVVFEIGAVAAPVPVGTTTTLVVSPSSDLMAGEPITLTATVSPVSGPVAAPTGAVTFADPAGGSVTVPLVAGTAVYSGKVPPVGTYSVYASYGGGQGFAGSSSATITKTVGLPSSE